MAVTSVTERGHGRSSTQNDRWERSYARVFDVITDDPKTAGGAVRTAVGIAIGATYATATEADIGAFCRSVEAECFATDGCQWQVTVQYGPFDALGRAENPLDEPAEVEWGFAQFEEVVEEDVAGAGILNSAGDPFDPPVVRDRSRSVLSVTRNEASFDASLASAYNDTVNSDTFFGAPAGQVKVSNISARRYWHPEVKYYWQVHYEFHFNSAGWAKRILDQGLRYLGSGERFPITLGGQPATSPVLLDGAGLDLTPGDPAVFLDFDVYESVAFQGTFNIEGA